jgi:DNA-directed RNA polymerase subunit M/transcription elongation factor TFIIS
MKSSVLKDFLHQEELKLRVDRLPLKVDRWKEFCARLYRKEFPFSVHALQQKAFQEYVDLRKKFTSDSVLTCPRCKGNKVSCISRQIARADESEDFFAKCLNPTCKYNWRFK